MFLMTQNETAIIPVINYIFVIVPSGKDDEPYKIDALPVNISVDNPGPEIVIGFFRTEHFAKNVLLNIASLIESGEAVYRVPTEPKPSLLL